jgi:hypothetical protein
MSQATQRKQRAIDPSRVSNIDNWFTFYKQKYANLVKRSVDGALLVLDPETLNRKSPVKIFEIPKGIDAITAMQNPELRAQASTHLEELRGKRQEMIQQTFAEYKDVETQLLEKIAEWRQTEPGTRIQLANEIGALQAKLEERNRAVEQAKYPHRFIQSDKLSRMTINYETRDERMTPFQVHRAVLYQTMPADRSISL